MRPPTPLWIPASFAGWRRSTAEHLVMPQAAAKTAARHADAGGPQHCVVAPTACCTWIGGHGTVPQEQKTQQSPGFGRSIVPQPRHW